MGLFIVNMIPVAQSGETNQDSEPNLAVNPANPLQIAGSAFTPDPLGGPNCPIFVSSDGGNTWAMNSIVPSNAGQSTSDITIRFATTSGILYAGILRRPGSLRLNILRTTNFLGPAAMTVLVDRTGNGVDQPYVQAATVLGGAGTGSDRVYVGDNDFNAASGRTATVDESLDASIAAPVFTSARIEARATSGQDGPPIRPAIHPDGTIYAAFYGWRSFVSSVATTDVVVVRDDNWGSGATPFTSLMEGGTAGRRVVTGRSVPFNLGSVFGQERFVASNLSIAVDPRNSSIVYVAWADRVGATDYTLHVRRSIDRGATWSAADIRTITNATNPALAINTRGVVGFLYQALTTVAGVQRWITHFERTTDDWATVTDLVLATVPANAPVRVFGPYIGDYVHLMTVGKNFYGIFSANNTPNNANFPNGVTYQRHANFTTQTLLGVDNVTPVAISIDPFFFRFFPLAADRDFYVRDWTDSAASKDTGLEPSTHPQFYLTSDVWNRRSNAAGGFNANDQPQSEDPRQAADGNNFAFARVSRNASGSAATVNLHFLFSEFGTGSNYQDAGAGADPTLAFVAADTVKTMTAGREWTLPVTSSHHTCLAVEISTTDDPIVAPSLLGRAPGWPTTDLAVLLDNNKAQRNMGVWPLGGSGQLTIHGILHNGATSIRNMQVRPIIRGKEAEFLGKPRFQLIGGPRTQDNPVPLREPFETTAMMPCENQWVALTLDVRQAPLGTTIPVLFEELVGNTVVNGFGMLLQVVRPVVFLAENLRSHAGELNRIAALYRMEEAAKRAKRFQELAGGKPTAAQYAGFLKENVDPEQEMLKEVLEKAEVGDRFGVAKALEGLRAALGGPAGDAIPFAHLTYVEKLDAFLTFAAKAAGDVADISQTVRWMADLMGRSRKFALLASARRLAGACNEFAAAYNARKRGNKDYPAFLKGLSRDLARFVSESKLEGLKPHVDRLLASLGTPASAQRAHWLLMVEMQKKG